MSPKKPGKPRTAGLKKPAKKQEEPRTPIASPKVIAERLWELKGAATQYRFAEQCEVNIRRVGEWLNRKNAPGAGSLAQIAMKNGVTVDWILGIPGAPKYRDQIRTEAILEADVAAYVERELTKRCPPTVAGAPEDMTWVVRGSAALEAAVAGLLPHAEEAIELERERTTLGREVDAIAETAKAFLDVVPAGPNARHLIALWNSALARWGAVLIRFEKRMRRNGTLLMPRRLVDEMHAPEPE